MGGVDVAAMVKGWDCCRSGTSSVPVRLSLPDATTRPQPHGRNQTTTRGDSTYKDVQAGHAQIHMLSRLPLALSSHIHLDSRGAVRHLFDGRYTLPLGHAEGRQHIVAEADEHRKHPDAGKGVYIVDAHFQIDLEVREERDDDEEDRGDVLDYKELV